MQLNMLLNVLASTEEWDDNFANQVMPEEMFLIFNACLGKMTKTCYYFIVYWK